MRWIATYEERAVQVAGLEHRRAALDAWSHGVARHHASAPETLARSWRELAAQSQQVARLWCREDNRTRPLERPAPMKSNFLRANSRAFLPHESTALTASSLDVAARGRGQERA